MEKGKKKKEKRKEFMTKWSSGRPVVIIILQFFLFDTNVA